MSRFCPWPMEAPYPTISHARHRASESSGKTLRQSRGEVGMPCTKTAGGPSPLSSQRMRRPSCSTNFDPSSVLTPVSNRGGHDYALPAGNVSVRSPAEAGSTSVPEEYRAVLRQAACDPNEVPLPAVFLVEQAL